MASPLTVALPRHRARTVRTQRATELARRRGLQGHRGRPSRMGTPLPFPHFFLQKCVLNLKMTVTETKRVARTVGNEEA